MLVPRTMENVGRPGGVRALSRKRRSDYCRNVNLWNRNTDVTQLFECSIGSKSGFAKVVLEHHGDIVSTPPVASNGIKTVGRCQFHSPVAPAFGRITDTAAY